MGRRRTKPVKYEITDGNIKGVISTTKTTDKTTVAYLMASINLTLAKREDGYYNDLIALRRSMNEYIKETIMHNDNYTNRYISEICLPQVFLYDTSVIHYNIYVNSYEEMTMKEHNEHLGIIFHEINTKLKKRLKDLKII